MNNQFEVMQSCILDGEKFEAGSILEIDASQDRRMRELLNEGILKRVVPSGSKRFIAASLFPLVAGLRRCRGDC